MYSLPLLKLYNIPYGRMPYADKITVNVLKLSAKW